MTEANSGNGWANFQMTPSLLCETLGPKLYRNKAACLYEIWRNASEASMADSAEWDPTKAQVEIWLIYNHPLAPKCWALVIKDNGCGFTDPRIKEFCQIGPRKTVGKRRVVRHGGGSQNRIGKFALFGLNKHTRDGAEDEGFYILTRTSSAGSVSMVEITPRKVVENTAVPREIGPDATELERYKNLKGSFSLIVVPNSVFTTVDEVRETLKWRLPRKQNLAIKTFVNGELLVAPPLANIKIEAGPIEAHLGRPKVAHRGEGIWLCDAKSGLRCALASKLDVPYPFGRPDIIGDIFVDITPGLLAHQDTARGSLDDRFLNDEDGSHEWANICTILETKIAPEARKILGDDDVIDPDNPHHKILYEFADMFRSCWGEARASGGDLTEPDPNKPKPPPKPPNPPPPPPPPGPPGPPPPPGPGKGRIRGIGIKIGSEEYYFQVIPSLDPLIYAEIGVKGRAICINPKYAVSLSIKAADAEHKLERILDAVARYHSPSDTEAAHKQATQLRDELERSKGRK